MTDPYLAVPIYEAKVSRDLRIVYQIDLDTDLETKVGFWIIVKRFLSSYNHFSRLTNRVRSVPFPEIYSLFILERSY